MNTLDTIVDEWFPIASSAEIRLGSARPYLGLNDADADLKAQRAFNLTIFGQDVAIVESQLPKLLPLNPRIEMINLPTPAASVIANG